MANRQKISQMTPKGANLAATDLLEISEDSGTGYITKSITGQEIIDAAAGGSFVPYTGATADVDLGAFHFEAAKGDFTHAGSVDTLTVNHGSGSGIGLLITKGGNNEGLKVNKTSGSGNAATVIGTLEATTIVKTGGTAAQFLMADGTTSSGGASNPFPMFLNGLFNIGTTAGIFFNFGTQNPTAFENLRQISVPYAVTFKNFFLTTNAVQPVSGSAVYTIRRNAVDTLIVVTVPAGSAQGTFSNTVNTAAFVAGDRISIKIVNNATTTTTLIALSIGTI